MPNGGGNNGKRIKYCDPITVHGQQVLVVRELKSDGSDGRILDVQVLLDDKQAHALHQKFKDRQSDWKTSCYTKIFQDELAAFEERCLKHPEYKDNGVGEFAKNLRDWTEFYAELEGLVNNKPQEIGVDPFKQLFSALERLRKKLGTIPEPFKDELLKHLDYFEAELVKAKNRRHPPLSQQEIRLVFSTLSSDPNLPSLGRFIAIQQRVLAEKAIDHLYGILDENESYKPWNRFKQAFLMHPLIKRLTAVARNIDYKGLDDYGARYLNGRNPIPDSMLENLKSSPEKAGDPKWTSIYPYLDREDDLEDIEDVLLVINGVPPKKRSNRYFWMGAVFLANLFDLAGALSIRFALIGIPALIAHLAVKASINLVKYSLGVAVGSFALLGGLKFAKKVFNSIVDLGTKFNTWIDAQFQKLDNWTSRTHQAFSPLIWMKKRRNMQLEVDNKIKENLNHPESFYEQVMTKFNESELTRVISQGMTTFVKMGVASWYNLRNTMVSIADNVFHLFSSTPYHERRKNRVAQITEKYCEMTRVHNCFLKPIREKNQNFITPLTRQLGSPAPQKNDFKGHEFRKPGEVWVANEMSSPLDFVDDVFVGLSGIIQKMFQESPGAATLFFLWANASFGMLTFPALATGATAVPKWISMAFMGKEVGPTHMINNVLAAFLQWKVTFFPLEAGLELYHDPSMMKEVFHNPEEKTLGILIAVSLGYALKYIPELHLPEYKGNDPAHLISTLQTVGSGYLHLLNIFPEESKEVTDFGTPPLTGLEYAFLSLKTIFLVRDLFSGGHHAHIQVSPEMHRLLGESTEKTQEFMKKFSKELKKLHRAYVKEQNDGQKLSLQELMNKVGEDDFKNKFLRPALMQAAGGQIMYAMGDEPYDPVINLLFNNLKESFQEVAAVAQDAQNISHNLSQVNQKQTYKTAVESKRATVFELIDTVIEMDTNGREFKSVSDAEAFYDHLYYSIKEYNEEQRRLGHWDQLIDKEQLLHSFYNKHIYPQYASNNFFRFLSYIPFAPITLLWRTIQGINRSPAAQFKIKRLYADDVSVAHQATTIVQMISTVLAMSYTYGALGIMLGTAAILAVPMNVADYFRRGFMGLGLPRKNEASWGTRFFNSVIDFAHTATPYNHVAYTLMRPLRYIATFIPPLKKLVGEAPVNPYEEKKSHQAAFHKQAQIAGREETLLVEAKNVKSQLNAHAAHAQKNPTTQAPLQEFKRKHAATKNGIFSSWHSKERKDEKKLLEAYSREFSILDELCRKTDKISRLEPQEHVTVHQAKQFLNLLREHKPVYSETLKIQITTMQEYSQALEEINRKAEAPYPH